MAARHGDAGAALGVLGAQAPEAGERGPHLRALVGLSLRTESQAAPAHELINAAALIHYRQSEPALLPVVQRASELELKAVVGERCFHRAAART